LGVSRPRGTGSTSTLVASPALPTEAPARCAALRWKSLSSSTAIGSVCPSKDFGAHRHVHLLDLIDRCAKKFGGETGEAGSSFWRRSRLAAPGHCDWDDECQAVSTPTGPLGKSAVPGAMNLLDDSSQSGHNTSSNIHDVWIDLQNLGVSQTSRQSANSRLLCRLGDRRLSSFVFPGGISGRAEA
jgi:hypothetical protein